MRSLTSLGARPTKNPLTPISLQTVRTARIRPGYIINSVSKNYDNGKNYKNDMNYRNYKSWKN